MKIRAITLDLDDTLWAIGPVIVRAEQIMCDYIASYYPNVLTTAGCEGMKLARAQIEHDYAHLRHDLTAMRQLCLERVFVDAGESVHSARTTMEVFLQARHDVTLFADVIPALEHIAARYPVVAISNGNADVSRLTIGHCFVDAVSARQVGVGKPDAAIFHTACRKLGLPPGDVLHVGDHPEQDVAGAIEAGMMACWMNRLDLSWQSDHKPQIVVEDFHALLDHLKTGTDWPSTNPIVKVQ